MNIQLTNSSTYFSGAISEHEYKNAAFQLCMDILRNNIWLYKLEKRLPSSNLILNEINRKFECIFKISNKTGAKFSKCEFFRGNEQHERGE